MTLRIQITKQDGTTEFREIGMSTIENMKCRCGKKLCEKNGREGHSRKDLMRCLAGANIDLYAMFKAAQKVSEAAKEKIIEGVENAPVS